MTNDAGWDWDVWQANMLLACLELGLTVDQILAHERKAAEQHFAERRCPESFAAKVKEGVCDGVV